jgi:hypothetical protein
MKEKQAEEVFEIKKIPFVNNKIQIENNKKQKIFPTSIKFILNDNQYELEDIIHSIGELNFIVKVGGYIIFSIPLNFFISLYGYNKKENIIKIPLEFKMFFENLIFYAKWQNIEIMLSEKHDNISESILKIKVSEFYGDMPRRNVIQQIDLIKIENNFLQTVNITLDSRSLTKGFFIGINLNDISRIKLQINGHDRFDYDEILLNTICKKINDDLFYIPLDINQEYTDCSENSYYSALNLARIDSTRFIFTFKNIPENISIYTLGLNYVSYNNELLGLMFK